MKSREQANQAVSKANSMLGVLKRTLTYRGVGMWKKLYNTRSHLEFAVPVWSPYLRGDITQLEGFRSEQLKLHKV